MPSLRVLLLDLDPGDATLVVDHLRRAGLDPQPTQAQGEAGLGGALDHSLDLVVANHAGSGVDARTTLRSICDRGLDVPLVVLSRALEEETAVELMKLGAWDCLRHDRIGRLAISVARALEARQLRRAQAAVRSALEEGEEISRVAFDEAPVGISHVDGEGRFLRVNRKLCEITGYGREELIGRTFQEITHPDDVAENVAHLRVTSSEGAARSPFLKRYVRKDGGIVWVQVTGGAVRDPSGHIRHFIGIIEDVTERRRTERRIGAQHEVTRVLAEATTIEEAAPRILRALCESLEWDEAEMWTIDPVGDVLRCIEAWCGTCVRSEFEVETRELRLRKGEGLPGRVWERGESRWIPDVASDPGFRRAAVACRQGWHASIGFPVRLGERTLGVIAFFCCEIRKPDADLLRTMTSVGSQIGLFMERIRTEQERSRLAEELRSMMDATGEGMIGIDLDGRCAFANRAALQMLRCPPEAIVGRDVCILLGDDCPKPDSPDCVERCALFSPTRTGRSATAEGVAFRRPDGTRFAVSFQTHPTLREGRITGALLAFTDVTERERLEAQLRQAQKMDAIGRLAGGVAHDFNNMLAVIRAYSDFLLQGLNPLDPMRADVEQIAQAADRAAGLTRQLLAFSRKQLMTPKVLDLNAVVADMDRMLRRLVQEDVEIRTVPGAGLGSVNVDPSQLEQVIVNLVVNARDAMPRGGTLSIETANAALDEHYAASHLEVEPGDYVMLAVSDTGAGMNEQTLSHLFEPFFTTKEKGKGTGLGLSTIYGIVKQAHGHISVYSEVGRGTTFRVYLPRVPAAPEAVAPSPAEAPRGGSETILVVEDDDSVRGLCDQILRRAGYRVLVASGGGDALLLCEKHEGAIRLLLTDVIMPRMNGPEIWGRLRESRPELRVLYMSGYADNAIGHHGVLDAGTPFLPKPFVAGELLRKVREIIDADPHGS